MPSPRSLSIVALVGMGVASALANVWFAAARSTIPVAVRGTVAAKEHLVEKKPGVDDVCLVHFLSGHSLHVDRPVFDAMSQGDNIEKRAGEQVLRVDDREIPLTWSPDTRGMVVAMPLMIAVCIGLGFIGFRISDC